MSSDAGIWVSICHLPSQDVRSKSQLYNVYLVMCMSLCCGFVLNSCCINNCSYNSFKACYFQDLNSVFLQKELFKCISSFVICGSEEVFRSSIVVFFQTLLSVICNVLITFEELSWNMAL